MTDGQKKKVKSYSKKIPILMSSNMSLGVNLLFNLVKQTASALKDTDYDIEIAETIINIKKMLLPELHYLWVNMQLGEEKLN